MSRTRNERKKDRAVLAFAWSVIALSVIVLAGASVELSREEPEPAPAPASYRQVKPEPVEEPEDFENEKIEAALLQRAQTIEDCTITHYCICERCCGKTPDHPAYGITASGLRATPGISVAVDPSIIPLGSDVLVDYGDGELHYFRADDTGGAIKGAHIDLCVEDHQTALTLGVKTATVYWVAPEK